MTITTIYAPEPYAYTGITTYPFGFESIGAEALEVWAVDVDGNRTYIAPSNYTSEFFPSNGAPIYDTGELTLTSALPAGTVTISIERNTPITQLVDFNPYGRFGANVLEFALDKLTMICHELDVRKCNSVDQIAGNTQP